MLTKREAELLRGIREHRNALVNVFECAPLQRRGLLEQARFSSYTSWNVTDAGCDALETFEAEEPRDA